MPCDQHYDCKACRREFDDLVDQIVALKAKPRAIEALAPGEGAREAFTKAALAYARCHWGKCADECHAHDSGISPEVDDAVHAENETHYRDEMREAYDAFLRSQP